MLRCKESLGLRTARFETSFEALLHNSSSAVPRFHLIVKNFPTDSARHVAKTQEKRHICVKKPLFFTVLAYLHCCPGFQNPIFSSSTHHPGLAGIVKCCGLEDSGFISFLDLPHYGHQHAQETGCAKFILHTLPGCVRSVAATHRKL